MVRRWIRTSRVDLVVVSLGIVLVEDVGGNVGGVVRVDHCAVVQTGRGAESLWRTHLYDPKVRFKACEFPRNQRLTKGQAEWRRRGRRAERDVGGRNKTGHSNPRFIPPQDAHHKASHFLQASQNISITCRYLPVSDPVIRPPIRLVET
jgi:hypothetical protein